MSQRVTVAQAAKELGMAPQGIREYMKRGLLNEIGYVLPSIEGERNQYFIFRDKLDEYMGKKLTMQEGG